MNVIVLINYDTGYVSEAYGNFKTACDFETELNYHRDKGKKLPFRLGDDIEVYKLRVLRGGRKNNKITSTELD